MTRRLAAHGLSVELARGWDARIFMRAESDATAPASDVPMSGWTMPVLHVADFSLPEQRGDYGSGAVQTMGPGNVFVALVEFGTESVGQPMFRIGRPRVRASAFHPQAMQRPVPGAAGMQRFFTEAGRAFCLYAVIGSHARRTALAARLGTAVARIDITAR